MLRINFSTHVAKRKGVTLIELIIVLPMILILGTILSIFTINATRSYRFSQLQTQSATQISTYLERVGRVTRGATQIISADAKSVTMYAYFSPRDTVPDRVRYFVDTDNSLKVGTIAATGTAPSYTYDNATETVQTLLSDIKNGSTAVFTYYDENNNLLNGTITPSAVKEIGLRLEINPDPTILKQNVVGQTRINLRNMKTNL